MRTPESSLCSCCFVDYGHVALSLPAEGRCAYGECKAPIVGTKVNTSYNYNAVRHVEHVTRYRDIRATHPVVNINRIVTMSQIQPVTHENRITRVHNRTDSPLRDSTFGQGRKCCRHDR